MIPTQAIKQKLKKLKITPMKCRKFPSALHLLSYHVSLLQSFCLEGFTHFLQNLASYLIMPLMLMHSLGFNCCLNANFIDMQETMSVVTLQES